MSDEFVIIPSDGEGYVPLARTRTGRIFRKHLLNLGPLRHPVTGQTIDVDENFYQTMKRNFDKNVCDIVQVPLANDANEHSEDPDKNIGEVVDIELNGDKIYAVLDIRDNDRADKLGKTLLGASAMMHLDYTDTRSGEKVGPTLLHSCVTNRPYVTGLDNYEEILAATSDSSSGAVLLTTDVIAVATDTPGEKEMGDESKTQETKPSLDDLLAILKTDHNIDVPALQAKAQDTEQATSLSKTLVDALTAAGVVKLSNTDNAQVANETVITAVAGLAKDNLALTNRVQTLEKADAEAAVDTLVREGRVLPPQRDAYVELKLSNPTMFAALIPAQPIVKLNNETGVAPKADDAHVKDIDNEVIRLAKLHDELANRK